MQLSGGRGRENIKNTLFSHIKGELNQQHETTLNELHWSQIIINSSWKNILKWQFYYVSMHLLSLLLAEVEVWEEVTVERTESIWIFAVVEAIDAHHIPIVFYVRVAEWDLRMRMSFNWLNDLINGHLAIMSEGLSNWIVSLPDRESSRCRCDPFARDASEMYWRRLEELSADTPR